MNQTKTQSERIDLKYYIFDRARSTDRLIKLLTNNDYVAKMAGFPYGEQLPNFAVQQYIANCKKLFEVHLNGKVVGYVGFERPQNFYLDKLRRSGRLGTSRPIASTLATETLEVTYLLDPGLNDINLHHGIGSQMVRDLTLHMFKTNQCCCIIANCGIFDGQINMASKRVAEKVGYRTYTQYKNIIACSGDLIDVESMYMLNPKVEKELVKMGILEEKFQSDLMRSWLEKNGTISSNLDNNEKE